MLPVEPKGPSELQSSLAGCVGQRLDATMKPKSVAIEDHRINAGVLRSLCQSGADLLRALGVTAKSIETLFSRTCREKRAAGEVVNDLTVNMLE